MSRLAGRVAIVTGAASGIGRATAERFAAEGAAVVVADVQAELGSTVADGIVAQGGRAAFARTDVTREADVAAMVQVALERFGRLDVLFNNAGIGAFVPFDQLDAATWDRIHAVNLRGVYLGCRHAVPAMRKGGGGAILNMASQSGLEGQPMNEAYCSSKAGVILFTRSLARELAPEGIRVNCLCPGGIDTPMLHAFAEGAKLGGLAARSPMRRFGRPEEVAAAALFLVSDDAAYITGIALPVDGGATA